MAQTSPDSKPFPRRYVILTLLLILALTVLLECWWFIPNYGAGADEASLFLAAKSLATHHSAAYLSPDPTAFVPENMIETSPGTFYPKYPIGYPLLCALAICAGKLGNAAMLAPFFVNPIMHLVATLGVFFLAGLFLDDLFALAAALFFAIHPALLYLAISAMSHASDLAAATWFLFFAFSWYFRPHFLKAIAAGLLLGIAASIRYTEVLLVLPLLALAAFRLLPAKSASGSPRRPIVLIAHMALSGMACMAALIPLLLYHLWAFGAFLRPGYALTGEASAFSMSFLRDHLPVALATLISFSAGISILFPLAFAGIIFLAVKDRAAAICLSLVIVPPILLYAAYYWINAQVPLLYARFFVTAFPPLLIAALFPLDRLSRKWNAAHYAIALAVGLLASFHLRAAPPLRDIQGSAFADRISVALATRHLPPDAVLIANGYSAYSLIYFTDMTIFYPRNFSQKWVEEHLPDPKTGASIFNPLRARLFADTFGGRSQDQLNKLLIERLTYYAHRGRTVALLTADAPPWQSVLLDSFAFTPLAQDAQTHITLYRLDLR